MILYNVLGRLIVIKNNCFPFSIMCFNHQIYFSYCHIFRFRSYGSILSLLRTLRMFRVLRLLEVAFRFTQVRIVFLALSRSVKLIFHVVILTILLNYFFALIALYLTQFGLNKTSNEHMNKINSLFGTGLKIGKHVSNSVED